MEKQLFQLNNFAEVQESVLKNNKQNEENIESDKNP